MFCVKMVKQRIYARFIKRALDIVFSIIVLVLFWWLFLIIAIAVRIKLGSPILFKQERPGKNEKIFRLYKFRSMTNTCDKTGKLLPDTERLTAFGKFLRSTSLDELPELFNIIKGDMSIVGPRPLAVQYLPYYNKFEKQRHLVLPGLTGLAQINGRNALNWPERFAYDIQYVNKISFRMDLYIIVQTVIKVIKRNDVGVRGTGNIMDFDVYRRMQMEEEDNCDSDRR
mgnify:CR=1 FL=1